MSKQNNREEELKRKEQELKMRKLEAEVEQIYTQKYKSSNLPSKSFSKQTSNFIKYIAFVAFGFFIITGGLFLVSIWLSYGIMFALLSFVGYKIFLEDK